MRKSQINPMDYTVTDPKRAAQALSQWTAREIGWDELVAQLSAAVA